MEKKKISFERRLEKGQVITLLEDMVTSLKHGVIVVKKGEKFTKLTPQSPIKMFFEASHSGKKGKIECALSWKGVQIDEKTAPPVLESKPLVPVSEQEEVAEPESEPEEVTEPEEDEEEYITIRWEN